MFELTDGSEPAAAAKPKKKQWNYHPELPIGVSPLFSRPFNPKAVFKWFVGGWLPLSEILIIYYLQHYTLSAATTHTGYEGIAIGGKMQLALGTFHHQMHHRQMHHHYFECNYGDLEYPATNGPDRLMMVRPSRINNSCKNEN
jgi:hypothetical protein